MEGLSQQELWTSIKVEYKMHKDKGKSAPQIRPIEQFWGCLKMKVYENNWEAKSREQLIRRIQKCICEFDFDVIINMFNSLKDKIHQANEQGLSTLN